MAEESEGSPAASSDLEGWRGAVTRGQLGSFRPEAWLCAVQDLGPDADPRVLNPIAKHLSDIIMKMARGYIGTNKPNMGEDIKPDILALIAWSREQKESIFEALKRADEIETLTPAGRIGLKRLGAELDGLQRASPWVLLTTWLFERSDYLRRLAAGQSTIAQQKMIAIYQLLKVCGEYGAMGQTNRKRFLDRIRRIEALNEDTAYRAISSEASDLDAARVMTIHGSKGLEFRGVHLPVIATGYMPSTRGGGTSPAAGGSRRRCTTWSARPSMSSRPAHGSAQSRPGRRTPSR